MKNLKNILLSLDFKKRLVFAFLFLIGGAFALSLFIGFEKTAAYWQPFLIMLFLSAMMMLLVKLWLKSDERMIFLTAVIMMVGIFAQALTLSVEAPVRKTLNLMYETAMSEELLEKYPDDKDQNEIKYSIKLCVQKNITPQTAKEAFTKAAQITHIDVLDYMQHLEDQKDKLLAKPSEPTEEVSKPTEESSKLTEDASEPTEELSESTEESSETAEEVSDQDDDFIFYKELYDGVFKVIPDHENKNLSGHIKLFRTDNYYQYSNPLTFSQAEKLDTFFSEHDDTIWYKDLVKQVEQEQRQDDVASIMKYIFLGYFLAMLVMACLNILCFNFDIITGVVFLLQMVLMAGMLILGKNSDDGAKISLGDINVLEFTKIAYIIIMANLVGKRTKKDIIMWPVRWIPRKLLQKLFKNFSPEKLVVRNRLWIALWYNVITAVFFLICSEMGTMVILLVTGILITLICTDRQERLEAFFPPHKKGIIAASFSIIAVAVILCSTAIGMYFYHIDSDHFVTDRMLAQTANYDNINDYDDEIRFCIFDKPNPNNFKEYGIFRAFMKIDQRFYGFFNAKPDNDNRILNNHSGIQYIQLINARNSAGWFGCPPEAEDSVEISVSQSDMIFGQIIHSLGVIVGLIVIMLYAALIAVAYGVLQKADDFYYRTLGLTCVILLAVQNLLNILVNLSWFPIAGVSLMYISRGGAIQAVSLIITMIILKVSSNSFEISSKNEKFVDDIMLYRDQSGSRIKRIKRIASLCLMKPGIECCLELCATVILFIITLLWW